MSAFHAEHSISPQSN